MVIQQPGSVLVVPVEHYENIFDLPAELGVPVQRAARSAAVAMKAAFGCDGVSTRQHNESAGDQDVSHYHLHVFPRWHDDQLDVLPAVPAAAEDVRWRADRLREAWPVGRCQVDGAPS